MDILIGADPELFVKDSKGRFRSAHGLIPGTKEEPFKVECGAVQVDGMALEFNIDPASSEEEFVGNISTVLRQLRERVPSEYSFEFVPTAKFNGNHMRVQPDCAKELGCMPDFNAYTLKENPRPDGNTTLRTASGHIHVGFCPPEADVNSEEHILKCATLVKHLDAFLGLRSLEWDQDNTRRRLYGKAGAMRVKPYGVEYRVLSNAWLRDERLVRLVYRQTVAAVNHLLNGGKDDDANYKYIANDINMGRKYFTNMGYAKNLVEIVGREKI